MAGTTKQYSDLGGTKGDLRFDVGREYVKSRNALASFLAPLPKPKPAPCVTRALRTLSPELRNLYERSPRKYPTFRMKYLTLRMKSRMPASKLRPH